MKEIFKRSWFQLTILTVLHAVFFAYSPMIFIFILLIMANNMAAWCAFCVCAVIPLLFGIIFVDKIKWWLISLPIQLLIDVGIRLAGIGIGYDQIGYIMIYAIVMLACQALGVGIKMIYRKIKGRISLS